MIFGDGAAAMVIVPAAPGTAGDVEVVQTYASGPRSSALATTRESRLASG
jgi:3-oxoacyl-[acyl-carrier-protein] synthase III